MMRLTQTLGLCVLLLISSAAFAAKDPAAFFDQSLGDFSEELDVAKEEGKKGVLLYFEMDECPFCSWMKSNVLNEPEVQAYFREHFKIYKVDIEGDVEIADFEGNMVSEKNFSQKQHRVRATPVFGFFDLEGNKITRYTGKTRNTEEFLWLGEYVAGEIYKQPRMSFNKYKRQKRAEQQGR